MKVLEGQFMFLRWVAGKMWKLMIYYLVLDVLNIFCDYWFEKV